MTPMAQLDGPPNRDFGESGEPHRSLLCLREKTISDADVVADPFIEKECAGDAMDRVQAAEGASTTAAKRRRCEGVASRCAAERARRGPEAGPTKHG